MRVINQAKAGVGQQALSGTLERAGLSPVPAPLGVAAVLSA